MKSLSLLTMFFCALFFLPNTIQAQCTKAQKAKCCASKMKSASTDAATTGVAKLTSSEELTKKDGKKCDITKCTPAQIAKCKASGKKVANTEKQEVNAQAVFTSITSEGKTTKKCDPKNCDPTKCDLTKCTPAQLAKCKAKCKSAAKATKTKVALAEETTTSDSSLK